MPQQKEFGIGRKVATATSGLITLASGYGVVHEWARPNSAIFFGSFAFVFGLLTTGIALKVDEWDFKGALKDKPPFWPGPIS